MLPPCSLHASKQAHDACYKTCPLHASSRQAHDAAAGVQVNVIEAGAGGQAGHHHHVAHQGDEEAGAHRRAQVPDRQHEAGGRTLPSCSTRQVSLCEAHLQSAAAAPQQGHTPTVYEFSGLGFRVKRTGGTLAAASAEKLYCVLAMQMGRPPKPMRVYSSICDSAFGRYSTLAAP